MYFKALFNPSLDEDLIEKFDLNIDLKSGVEILRYDNHSFEIIRNNIGEISSLTFCNECINTYDIERVFIALLYNIIADDKSVRLIDSNGAEDILNRDELLEYLS